MSQSCDLTVQRMVGGYLIHLCGRGTLQQSPAVRDFVLGAAADGVKVVLDLSECEYLDSTFLGCLAVLSRPCAGKPPHFAVRADAAACKRLFSASHLEPVLSLTTEQLKVIGAPVVLPTVALERREFGRHLLETHEELCNLGGPQASAFRAVADQLKRDLDETI